MQVQFQDPVQSLPCLYTSPNTSQRGELVGSKPQRVELLARVDLSLDTEA